MLGKDAAKGNKGKTVPAVKRAAANTKKAVTKMAKKVAAKKPVKRAVKKVTAVAKKAGTVVQKAVTGKKPAKAIGGRKATSQKSARKGAK